MIKISVEDFMRYKKNLALIDVQFWKLCNFSIVDGDYVIGFKPGFMINHDKVLDIEFENEIFFIRTAGRTYQVQIFKSYIPEELTRSENV